MTPEHFGTVMAASKNGGPDFEKRVAELGSAICDEMIREIAVDLRKTAESELGIKWVDVDPGEKHYDFAMSFEGDMCRFIKNALVKYLQEY